MNNEIYEIKNYINDKSAFFYCFDGSSDVVCNQIKMGNNWEIGLRNVIINTKLNENSVILEAGTHIGVHSILLASKCNKLYGFEPFPETYELFKKNLKLNNIDNIIFSNKALSNKHNVLNVEYHSPVSRNIGGWGIHFTKEKDFVNKESKFISIETITIDSLNLERLDLIKLDVEGHELDVIEGGINTIKKYKPIIILEDWYNNSADLNITKNKFNILINIGYNLTMIEGGPDFIFEHEEKNIIIL